VVADDDQLERAMGSIKGLVIGADDKPLKGIRVSIGGVDETPTPQAHSVETTATANANFQFSNIPAGKYRITFPQFVQLQPAGSGYLVLVDGDPSQTLSVTAAQPNRETRDRQYEQQALAIKGKVVDDQGRSLSGIPVFLKPEGIDDDATRSQLTLKARTVDGAYRFAGLVKGKYTVSFLKELPYRDPVAGTILIQVQKPNETGRKEVELDAAAETVVDAQYIAGGTSGAPPEVVFQAISDSRDTWDVASRLLADAATFAAGTAGYADQLSELAGTAAMEAAWFRDVQLNVTVENAPDLFVTLAYRAHEKQAVIQGRIRGLTESIDQAVRPPPVADAARLIELREKLAAVAEEVDKLNDVFPV
jgi:hypothetical protein